MCKTCPRDRICINLHSFYTDNFTCSYPISCFTENTKTMIIRFSTLPLIAILLLLVSCSAQETVKELSDTKTEEAERLKEKKAEPHRYGGWYCPDNFGFVPVDIQKLDEIPAISDRLPTEEELHDHKSLINVDIEKYPDARALDMDLPRVAQIYSEHKGMSELVIIIQAIVVQDDTVVGYRFVNGGNGSGWMRDVTFLSEDEVASRGSQPFFFSKTILKAKPAGIWKAITRTDYFKELGEKFDEQEFFGADWDPESRVRLAREVDGEKAKGYVAMVYGNYYLHIDYIRNGVHYSEKMLIMENQENNTTELFFASGPYPEGFEKKKSYWENWVESVKLGSRTY